MKDQARIAIIGAGTGGLTAAILLQRYGYDVTVFEAVPKLERLGAGINVSPHITRLFRDLGMLDRMIEVGVLPQNRYGRNGFSGDITFTVPVDKYTEMYGAPHLIMHRGDLQESLVNEVTGEAIKLGKRLVDIEDTSTGSRLIFADSTTSEADIVVGADGINSRVRELLLGVEKPIYTGEVAYRSIFPVELLGDLEVADHTKWWGGDDGLHILVYYITRARDVIYFVTGNPEPDWGSDSYAPRPANMQQLHDAFAGFHPDLMRVIDAAPAATAWPILERDPLPLWSRGRIVMLGDACHPMRPHMGQGAAMAIEDGAMLARCIDHFKGNDAQSIFQLYELQRRERASRVQLSAQGGDWLRYKFGDSKGNADWLYTYNVLTVPLETENANAETVLA